MDRPTTKRRSSSVVKHRQPFWGGDDQKWQANINATRRSNHLSDGNTVDNLDNFSYDESHVKQWQMPDGLAERLPDTLLANVRDWQKGGAALCTALDRIYRTHKSAVTHAYPEKSDSQFSRRASDQAIAGADTPRTTASMAPSPMSSGLKPLVLAESAPPKLSINTAMGMETPPFSPAFSPVDSAGCGTPYSYTSSGASLPDLCRIDSQLLPLDTDQANVPVPPGFDAMRWDYYLGKFDNELKDLKTRANAFNGYRHHVKVLCIELAQELKPEIKLAMMDFTKWWESMQPKVSEIVRRAKAVVAPKLVDVTMDVEEARAAVQAGRAAAGTGGMNGVVS